MSRHAKGGGTNRRTAHGHRISVWYHPVYPLRDTRWKQGHNAGRGRGGGGRGLTTAHGSRRAGGTAWVCIG